MQNNPLTIPRTIADAVTNQLPSSSMGTNSPSEALIYLAAARQNHSQGAIAKHLGVSERQVRRWEVRESLPPPYVGVALQQLLPFQIPFDEAAYGKPKFKFIDLFAGIGGIRLPFEALGGQCVFTSEWDSYAQKTYSANFRTTEAIHGDITQISTREIPDHDILLGGFPCQPFSIAGVSKKNSLGLAHGFEDATQGTLFFDVARIIAEKRPKMFLLENVKNLQSHDKGRTFDVVMQTLRNQLGYTVFAKVIDGAHFVPQHRERIIILGFRDAADFDWEALDLPSKNEHLLAEVLHKKIGEPYIDSDGTNYFDYNTKKVHSKYTLTDNLWQYLQDYKKKHQAAGNGFGFGIVTPKSVTRTLSARYYKDGSEILLSQGAHKAPRRLTPRECARLMGFPDSFRIPVSDTRAYQQFGNSVVVPVIAEVAKAISPFLTEAQSNTASEINVTRKKPIRKLQLVK
jgi:DNA (cytosine-5)-methyltransferase 1